MNPLDSYFGDRATKTAGLGAFGQEFRRAAFNPKTLGGVAGVGLGAAAIGAVAPIAHKIQMAITKSNDFKGMMRYNPDLEYARERDPALFSQQYTSLRNVNPQFGRDPLISGHFMRLMTANPDMGSHGVLTQAAQGHSPPDQPAWARAAIGQFGKDEKPGKSPEEIELLRLKVEEAKRAPGVRAAERAEDMRLREQDMAARANVSQLQDYRRAQEASRTQRRADAQEHRSQEEYSLKHPELVHRNLAALGQLHDIGYKY